ncbi:hypothetical protein D7V97_16940 [Corallococcus sp. CA053C]|uniref:hypothetical protein n=1 Tax=Corallococcus sp. CA053C TaxID=2316732 RepID=UPI000EA0AEED|nr:hypothetical protein [Corallococcus sp. CA053C]RKH09314.1 hypothetical protein D7V97_16940 [Corallococcus sp. CA053C]
MRASFRRPALLLLLTTCALPGCTSESDPMPGDPPDSGVVDTGCPAPTGAAITHQGTVSAPETWSATSPHVVSSLDVNAAVTVEPCAVVSVSSGANIAVNSGGTFVTQGTQAKPVHIQAVDSGRPWGQLLVNTGSTVRLTWTTLSQGGNPSSADATVRVRAGADLPGARPLFVDHVTIEDSRGPGILLNGTAGFADGSTALTITRSGSEARPQPLVINPNALGTLPSGTYTGNREDAILVGPAIASATISYLGGNATVRDLGVPYHVQDLTVGNHDTAATLTLEAGAELRFDPASRLLVYDGKSALIAAGTQARPVVFTSAKATPVAGDWAGLRFEGTNPTNRLENIRVRYAGGTCQCSSYGCNYLPPSFDVSSAILLFTEPTTAFITGASIEDSAGHGILRGWSGSASVDFVATNTFARIAECTQTLPRDTEGRCPSNPTCPRAP